MKKRTVKIGVGLAVILLIGMRWCQLHKQEVEQADEINLAYDRGFTTALSNVLMRVECQTNLTYQTVYEMVKEEMNNK